VRLLRLEIDDFALVAHAELEFANGFTVCSGETGSGKTMLLGALAFVLGERASAEIVRAGASRTRVTLEVESDAVLQARLLEDGFEGERGEAVLFTRELSASGKSTARVNGQLATAAQLRTFGETFVERIGQHEQQRLLSRAYQLDVLDAFGGEAATAKRAEIVRAYERSIVAERALRELTDDVGRAAAELEFARFAAAEIDDTALADGEDATLRERRDYLANVEKIKTALAGVRETLAGEGGVHEGLGSAAGALGALSRYGASLAALAATLSGLQSETHEAAVAIVRELEATEYDPGELEAVAARLDFIERIKKKYGGSLAAVRETRERFEETIARETTRDEREAQLRSEAAAARGDLASASAALSALRAVSARALETRVAAELAGLAMPAARFAVVLEPLPDIGPSGAESVEFGLSPNRGEPVRPLARAASGGELSRVLLALVVVLAGRRERTALVFDEVDAGIGGATANAVGVRLGALATTSQVFCVTHLAQVASWADRHYVLRKDVKRNVTVVEVVPLDDDRRVLEELARMLSGSSAAVAIEHAQSLVRDVLAKKEKLLTPK